MTVHIVGAGPTGALLALLLRRRGLDVTLFESRADPRASGHESGRSINLALADRGIHALKVAGVYEDIADTLVPMRGRSIHQRDGTRAFQPYGRHPREVIYSVSRHRLNQVLLEVASRRYALDVRFLHRLEEADFDRGIATVRNTRDGSLMNVPMQPLLAADGAGSPTRRCMAAQGLIAAREVDLDHGYKELTIPPGPHGDYAFAGDALHIWPRGNFMLIALPNADRSFTATLFLPKQGQTSFDTLNCNGAIERFLSAQFPDVYALMPDCIEEFMRNPTGFLGTVYADPWQVGGKALLVGDSAHAIVPFHGQGMNCCLEDCLAFDGCYARHATAGGPDWLAVFEEFLMERKANTDAIAAMALENYLEMRERVADAKFRLQQSLALELERRHPDRFIPRYSMVMFHHEIPYRTARDRGDVQSRLLADLTQDAATLTDIDYRHAERIIVRELPPIALDPGPA